MKALFLVAIVLAGACPGAARAADSVREWGDALRLALPAYAMGMAVEEEGWSAAGQFSASLVGAQVSSELLKKATRVERPDYRPGAKKDSFPSGHSAAAFSAATFIHKRYGVQRAAVPYALAAFTAYSRVHADRHRWRDV
ncbi:MAG: phosphatase PAP2 family protein, partial [Rickettsiales bacterium]|nr:phosphatase PAP2 family protein [Rickettsiales bacterium]